MAKAKSEPPKFEIVDEIAILEESQKSDWTVELNKVSWNDRPPKLEIRDWNRGHADGMKAGKGVTLSDEAADRLVIELLKLGYGDMKEVAKTYNERRKK